MPALYSRMGQLILSNWKSHQIVSWKPWNHSQTAAADSGLIVPTLTHNDAALTHTERRKETLQHWGAKNKQNTRTLNHHKMTNEPETSDSAVIYMEMSTPLLQPSLLSRNRKIEQTSNQIRQDVTTRWREAKQNVTRRGEISQDDRVYRSGH